MRPMLVFQVRLGASQLGSCRPQLLALRSNCYAELAHSLPSDDSALVPSRNGVDGRRLLLAALSGSVGAYPVRVRSPLPWTTTLAGNGHESTVTKRDETVHRR